MNVVIIMLTMRNGDDFLVIVNPFIMSVCTFVRACVLVLGCVFHHKVR